MFAYEQCLLCLAYHPDIWIEAAAYLEQSSKILTEKGVSVMCLAAYIARFYHDELRKCFDISIIFAQNIDCGYWLELPW